MTKRRGGVVWSSDPKAQGRGEGPHPSSERASFPPPETGQAKLGQQTARLGRTRKGRAGKTVVTIEGLELDPDGLCDLARVVRQRCGTGGTVREGVIEVQGDIRDRVAAVLQELGYRIKLVGG
jgi:translation initiation factor 1